MPQIRPPKKLLPGQTLSAREYNKGVDQIARGVRLTTESPLRSTASPTGTQLSIDTSTWPFLARLTHVYTPASGAQAGLNLYAFIEQSFDPTTGIPLDATPGRQTYPQTGAPLSAYAIEENNTLLTLPGATPAGYGNPGPYVEMRLQSFVEGVAVYQFSESASAAANIANAGSSGGAIGYVCLGPILTELVCEAGTAVATTQYLVIPCNNPCGAYLADECPGSGSSGSGGNTDGPSFSYLCGGEQLSSQYSLTLSSTACPVIDGTVTLVWNGSAWYWAGYIGGHYVTIDLAPLDSGDNPLVLTFTGLNLGEYSEIDIGTSAIQCNPMSFSFTESSFDLSALGCSNSSDLTLTLS